MIIVCLLLLLPLLLLRRRLRRLRRLYCRRRPRVRRHRLLLYHIPQRHETPKHGDLGSADPRSGRVGGCPEGLTINALIIKKQYYYYVLLIILAFINYILP